MTAPMLDESILESVDIRPTCEMEECEIECGAPAAYWIEAHCCTAKNARPDGISPGFVCGEHLDELKSRFADPRYLCRCTRCAKAFPTIADFAPVVVKL